MIEDGVGDISTYYWLHMHTKEEKPAKSASRLWM